MDITPELINRYHQGLCSTEEQKAVEAWLDSPYPDAASAREISPEKRQEIGQRVWQQLNPAPARRSLWRKFSPAFSKIAASVLLVGMIWWYFQFFQKPEVSTAPVKQQTARTAKSQKARIILPDGTRVVLNDDSEITFPAVFDDTIRHVFLHGQAYFEVTKNPSQPFIVETATTKTRVLGTAFDLKAYPNENITTIKVTEGTVRFTSLSAPVRETLTAGQQAISEPDQMRVHPEKHLRSQPAWTENKLEFDDMPLGEIVPILERWYDADIRISKPKLKNERYTAQFHGAPVATVIKSMSQAVGFTYEIKGKSINIH